MATDGLKWVRGFNYQPSWGRNGITVWNCFDADGFRREIDLGLKYFPGMNALRIWFSFDAFIDDRKLFLRAASEAAEIVRDRGLKIIPVLFNGWHAIPDFGGFTRESLLMGESRGGWKYEMEYIDGVLSGLRSADVIAVDLANEPYASLRHEEDADIFNRFFRVIAAHIRKTFPELPLTCGTWGMLYDRTRDVITDLEVIGPELDVISVHPYFFCFGGESRENYAALLDNVQGVLKRFGKPVMASECNGFAKTDRERVATARRELEEFRRLGWGFLPHALHESGVADLNRHAYYAPGSEGAMHFIEKDGSLRPFHQFFNDFC